MNFEMITDKSIALVISNVENENDIQLTRIKPVAAEIKEILLKWVLFRKSWGQQ